MTGPYLAEVTAEGPAGGKLVCVKLGSTSAGSRRLALRWLRDQAHRLADGLDPAPNAWWARDAPGALVELPGPRTDVPTELRRWESDDHAHEDALALLAAGSPVAFTVADYSGRYTLAIWPVSRSLAPAKRRADLESSTASP
ncbi:hypothetical protein AB0G74_12620 [Streptomyces sp. NPDC020875]|uniref:hypothetical protein n=1 Tax=Streptomyces sp. NPDC020875 TaxID=3154898 RepID=UPI0033F7A1CE